MVTTRGSQRAPSRTPPFILVGLVIVLSFLGFSYWSLSSSNSDLSSQLKTVNLEKREVDNKHSNLQKTLETAKAQVVSFQLQANELKENVEARESEINTLKSDLAQKASDNDKQIILLDQCDEKLSVVQKDLEAANAEKSTLQLTLDAERDKIHVCSMELCQSSVHHVLKIAAKLVGSDQMKKALADAQLDANKLMAGIDIPATEFEHTEQKEEMKVDGQSAKPSGQQQAGKLENKENADMLQDNKNVSIEKQKKLENIKMTETDVNDSKKVFEDHQFELMNSSGIQLHNISHAIKGNSSNADVGIYDNNDHFDVYDDTADKESENKFEEDEEDNGGIKPKPIDYNELNQATEDNIEGKKDEIENAREKERLEEEKDNTGPGEDKNNIVKKDKVDDKDLGAGFGAVTTSSYAGESQQRGEKQLYDQIDMKMNTAEGISKDEKAFKDMSVEQKNALHFQEETKGNSNPDKSKSNDAVYHLNSGNVLGK